MLSQLCNWEKTQSVQEWWWFLYVEVVRRAFRHARTYVPPLATALWMGNSHIFESLSGRLALEGISRIIRQRWLCKLCHQHKNAIQPRLESAFHTIIIITHNGDVHSRITLCMSAVWPMLQLVLFLRSCVLRPHICPDAWSSRRWVWRCLLKYHIVISIFCSIHSLI